MRNRAMALILMVSLPIAPAICDGAISSTETPAAPCHAHATPAPSTGDLGPDDEGQCCAACDAYITGKLSPDTALQLALLTAPGAPLLRVPNRTSVEDPAHLPPDRSSSPFQRQNSPLRI